MALKLSHGNIYWRRNLIFLAFPSSVHSASGSSPPCQPPVQDQSPWTTSHPPSVCSVPGSRHSPRAGSPYRRCAQALPPCTSTLAGSCLGQTPLPSRRAPRPFPSLCSLLSVASASRGLGRPCRVCGLFGCCVGVCWRIALTVLLVRGTVDGSGKVLAS